MSTNSIFRAISCQHFRLLTIVWHLDDNQGPQFDKRLQQMFNFAEGRWLLWYIFFQFIYFMVGFDRIIWLVSSHMNLMGWLAFHWDQVIPGIILCRRFSFVLPARRYLEWFCEMHAMSLCQKRNVSLRNVSLSKEKWRTSIHAMVCSTKQPLHARKIKIYEFVNSMKIWEASSVTFRTAAFSPSSHFSHYFRCVSGPKVHPCIASINQTSPPLPAMNVKNVICSFKKIKCDDQRGPQ